MTKNVVPTNWTSSLYSWSDGTDRSWPQPVSSGLAFPRTAIVGISGSGSTANAHYPPTPYSSQVTGHVISTAGFFSTATYDGNPVAWLGRFDIALIAEPWEGWDDSGTYDMALLIDAIKQITYQTGYSPASVWQHVMYESIHSVDTVGPSETLYQTVINEKWPLWSAANESGSLVDTGTSGGGYEYYESNWAVAWPNAVGSVAADQAFSTHRTTAYYNNSPEDFPQYCAAYFTEKTIIRHSSVTLTVSGTIGASAYTDPRLYQNLLAGDDDAQKAPNLDAIFTDNCFAYPRFGGYYDLKNYYAGGDTTSPVGPWMLRGAQHLFNRYQQIMAEAYPGRTYLSTANFGSWAVVHVTSPSAFTAVVNGIQGYIHGGVLENEIGSSYGIEKVHGWLPLIQAYNAMVDVCSAPKMVVLSGEASSSTDYQTARYVLTSTLMDDGYASVNVSGSYVVDNFVWYDEYGGNPGTNIKKGYLGFPKTNRPTSSAVNGVWIRDFDHGVALCNPSSNTSQTITAAQINSYLGTNYSLSFFQGTQNPTLNSGLAMSSVTLQPGDGVILLH